MASIDSSIKWFTDRLGKVTYSMTNRYGPNSYDRPPLISSVNKLTYPVIYMDRV